MIEYEDLTTIQREAPCWWDRFGAAWVVISTLMDPSAFWLRHEDSGN